MSAVGEDALRLPLQDSNHMNGLNLAFVRIPLAIAEKTFRALVG
jgi:hypothetical protein